MACWRTQLPHGTPELSESHLFPRYHQSAFFISSTSCCFSYLCCEWPPCFTLCHRIRLDASCRLCFVHRSSHSNKTSDLEDDKPRVLRDQPLEMGACGSSCCGGMDIECLDRRQETHSDDSQANLATACMSQSWRRAREKLLQTSFNTWKMYEQLCQALHIRSS